MDLPTQENNTTGKHSFMDAVRAHTHHFTWSWFIWPMATLGLSLLIAALPYRFDGLTTIGIIIYLFGVVTYTILLILIFIHFCVNKGSFKRSLEKRVETLFSATVLLGAASLLCGAHQYGHPAEGSRLASTLRVLFWVYIALAYSVGMALYFCIFTGECHLLVGNMTPAVSNCVLRGYFDSERKLIQVPFAVDVTYLPGDSYWHCRWYNCINARTCSRIANPDLWTHFSR